jgi:hypothetical protein
MNNVRRCKYFSSWRRGKQANLLHELGEGGVVLLALDQEVERVLGIGDVLGVSLGPFHLPHTT